MAALGRLSKTRHVAVGLAIAGTSALAAFGVIGDGNPEERFDTWQTIVEPAGGNALRITETFDQDFGDDKRHHSERSPTISGRRPTSRLPHPTRPRT